MRNSSAGQKLARNSAFSQSRQPFAGDPALRLEDSNVTGPVNFLNPTRAPYRSAAVFEKRTDAPSEPPKKPQSAPAVAYRWTSRNNRKGRHAIAISSLKATSDTKFSVPSVTSSWKETSRGLWRMISTYPVWDISYDVAMIFTLGSVVWVFNAFFVWLPLVRPDTEFATEVLYGGGITAFLGATIFEVGSFLLLAEAVNENRTGCFGWALEQAISHDTEDGSQGVRFRPSESVCTHHHFNRANLVGKGRDVQRKQIADPGSEPSRQSKSWTWFPSMVELRTHYFHELGFLASLTQLFAATIFWVSGFTALPGIYNHMSRPITIIFYWTPQVIGGTGFIISGALFMLETQSHWYKPAFKTLGWWIGVWNLVGGIGFTMCPVFGYDESSWAQYQACLSTFWGSWAFLMGSVIQWYESLAKFPVEVDESLEPKNGLDSGKEIP